MRKSCEFFGQLKTTLPTEEDKGLFEETMSQLINKINIIEVDYFRAKYQQEFGDTQTPETIENMAELTKLKNYHKLPTVMQYWARRGGWGDIIHNPAAHILAVKRIQAWSSSATPKPKTSRLSLFRAPEVQTAEEVGSSSLASRGISG
ncbi:hypothetical protein [Legionella yabuuchiae]|uniref:hypothetical protein n=1 Tax=Legionella yabuuchiae TaxID=376727 RepID=UPI0013EF6798|nr:hypothetical protein [Legionella yabuuchiae]